MKTPSLEEIQRWIVRHLSESLAVPPETIKRSGVFNELGVDSTIGIEMTGSLSDWLALELDPTVVYDFPTVTLLANQLYRLATANGRA
jgi:acyl carrier protein